MADQNIKNTIKRYLNSQVSPVEEDLVDDWLQHDEKFREWLHREIEESPEDVPQDVAERIDRYSKALFGEEVLSSMPAAREFDRAMQGQVASISAKRQSVIWKCLAIAAVICIVAMLPVIYDALSDPYQEKPIIAVTLAGERAKLTLPDGSTVFLNHESDISYQYDKKQKKRIVQMHGEVAFDVATDRKKPFMVYCDGLEVECRGTRFNVKGYPDDHSIETLLIDGSVIARTHDQSVTMKPGSKVTYQKHSRNLVSSVTDLANYTEWYNIDYDKFQNDRLEDILKTLSHRYGISFAIANPDLKGIRLTGSIGSKSLKEAIEVVASVSDTEYEIESDSVVYFYRKRR